MGQIKEGKQKKGGKNMIFNDTVDKAVHVKRTSVKLLASRNLCMQMANGKSTVRRLEALDGCTYGAHVSA